MRIILMFCVGTGIGFDIVFAATYTDSEGTTYDKVLDIRLIFFAIMLGIEYDGALTQSVE